MKRMIAAACVLAMISSAAWAQQPAAQTPAQKTHAAKKSKKQAPAQAEPAVAPAPVPAQVMPPIPATLMNSAPVNPTVTMQDGMLTIDAPNSTLSEVLGGIHKATGAVVEGPTPGERVVVRLGPGDPRQVIAALLQGTPYDYVILGSQEKQDAVTRILLTQASAASSAPNAPGGGQPQPAMSQPPEETFQDRTADEPIVAQPFVETEAEQPQAQPPPPQVQDRNMPKTPEQLFKELQPTDQPKPQQQ
jgi:hypothetical protein